MLKTLQKKWKERKGFTLVEMVVVLVIIAILAALMLPALSGYIERAQKKAVTADTRSVVLAVQTEMADIYTANKTAIDPSGNTANREALIATIEDLAGLKCTAIVRTGGTNLTSDGMCYIKVKDKYKVEELQYREDGWIGTYKDDGTITVEKAQ